MIDSNYFLCHLAANTIGGALIDKNVDSNCDLDEDNKEVISSSSSSSFF